MVQIHDYRYTCRDGVLAVENGLFQKSPALSLYKGVYLMKIVSPRRRAALLSVCAHSRQGGKVTNSRA